MQSVNTSQNGAKLVARGAEYDSICIRGGTHLLLPLCSAKSSVQRFDCTCVPTQIHESVSASGRRLVLVSWIELTSVLSLIKEYSVGYCRAFAVLENGVLGMSKRDGKGDEVSWGFGMGERERGREVGVN